MAIQVDCPCGARFRVPDQMVGRSGRCPKCSASVTVPRAEDAIPFDDAAEIGLIQPTVAPCPACGSFYAPEIKICVRCQIELATGRSLRAEEPAPESTEASAPPPVAPRPRVVVGTEAPLPTGRKEILRTPRTAPDEKKFLTALGQVFTNPFEAFDALGYYLLTDHVNIGLTLGLFFFGLVFSATWQSITTPAEAPAPREARPRAPVGQPGQGPEEERPFRFVEADGEAENARWSMLLTVEGDNEGNLSLGARVRPARPIAADHDLRVAARLDDGRTVRLERIGKGEDLFFARNEANVDSMRRGEGEVPVVFVVREMDAAGEVVAAEEKEVVVDFDPAGDGVDIDPDVARGALQGLAVVGWGLGLIIAMIFKAGFVDLSARVLAGTSRFLQFVMVLLFLEGVYGLCKAVLLVMSLFVDWTLLILPALMLWAWSIFLYVVAITKTYGIPGVFAVAVAVAANVIARMCIIGVVIGAVLVFLQTR